MNTDSVSIPSFLPSYVQDLDFLGFILGLESTVAAEDFVTSTLAFIYPSLLYAKVSNTFESASIPFKFEVVMYLLETSILLCFQGFCIHQWPSSASSSPRELELKPVTTLISIPAA